MKKIFKLLLGILGVSVIFVTIGSLCIGFVFWHYGRYLPDYQQLINYEPPTATRLHAGDGRLLKEFARENRVFVPIDSLPKRVINAFVAAEDQNFFSHGGIDLIGVVRAIITNIQNFGSEKRLVGASTITQQVAKNFLLSNEISINRKIKEAILAFRIERALSKERILELYLNQIYLGSGSYGIAAASLRYFDKAITELDYVEASLLAALPKAPSKYNPFKNKELAKFRRNLVLKNLYENNFISEAQYNSFIKEPIKLKKRKKIYLEDARYYVEDVRKDVLEYYGFDKVYKQGFNIKTPLDLELQQIATQSLRVGLEKFDRRKGWRGPLTNKKKN